MPIDKRVQIILEAQDRASGVFAKLTRGSNLLKVGIAGLVVAMGVKAVKAAMAWETQMTNIATLISGDSTQAVEKLSDGIKELLLTIPKSADELGAAAYDILSAGISDTAEALKVLEASGKLAVGGLGSTKEATDLMTSAINAFQLSASDATRISDVLFKTVKMGKTTVAELAGAFGMVAPIAKTLGVTLEELQAGTAALTTSGVKAAVAQTQMRAMFAALLSPSTDLTDAITKMGFASGAASIESLGLGGTLEGLKESVDGDAIAFGNLFGRIEATAGALALTGAQSESYNETLRMMTVGVNELEEAFGKQSETAAAQYQLLTNYLNVAWMELGAEILPSVITVVKGLIELLKGLAEIGKFVVDIFTVGFIQAVTNIRQLVQEAKRAQEVAAAGLPEGFIGALQPPLTEREKAVAGAGLPSGFIGALPPGFQEGGIVTKPTLAMVGEKEPELIIPFSKLGGGSTVFDFRGATVYDRDNFIKMIFKEFDKRQRAIDLGAA